MSQNEYSIRWRRKQRVVTFTLSPEKDKDIIDFLDNSELPNATLTKQVIRAYMAMQQAMPKNK